MRFNVYVLDVWGNASDGYEVNQRFAKGTVTLAEDALPNEIYAAIENLLGCKIERQFAELFIGQDYIEVLDSTTGMPVFQLDNESEGAQ